MQFLFDWKLTLNCSIQGTKILLSHPKKWQAAISHHVVLPGVGKEGEQPEQAGCERRRPHALPRRHCPSPLPYGGPHLFRGMNLHTEHTPWLAPGTTNIHNLQREEMVSDQGGFSDQEKIIKSQQVWQVSGWVLLFELARLHMTLELTLRFHRDPGFARREGRGRGSTTVPRKRHESRQSLRWDRGLSALTSQRGKYDHGAGCSTLWLLPYRVLLPQPLNLAALATRFDEKWCCLCSKPELRDPMGPLKPSPHEPGLLTCWATKDKWLLPQPTASWLPGTVREALTANWISTQVPSQLRPAEIPNGSYPKLRTK